MEISYKRVEDLNDIIHKHEEVLVVDILPEDRFNNIHIPGAVNACVYTVAFLDELSGIAPDLNDTVIIYGASERSHEAFVASDKMRRAGYTNVYILKGGLEEWKRSGYQLEGKKTNEEESPQTLLTVKDGSYSLDTAESLVQWTGRNQHSTHYGTVDCSEGTFTLANKTLNGALVVDMNSIKNLNLAGDDLQPVLEAHLKSDDFFFVELFKTAKLVLKDSSIATTPYLTSSNCMLRGELTLRGITKNLEFDATLTTTPDDDLLIEAHFDLDRTRWNIIYGSAKYFEFLGMHQVFDDISIQLRLKLHPAR